MAFAAGGEASADVTAAPSGPANPWGSLHAKRTYVSGALWLAALLLESFTNLGTGGSAFAVAVASALVGGANFFPAAWRALRSARLDMNVLMSLALVAAILIDEAVEAATLAFLFSFAELLERAAIQRTRRAMTRLHELAPDVVEVVGPGGVTEERASADLFVGDVYRVRAGGRLAADGIVRQGASSVDQATITGESLPVTKRPRRSVTAVLGAPCRMTVAPWSGARVSSESVTTPRMVPCAAAGAAAIRRRMSGARKR